MSTDNICEICNNCESKYTCPKCGKLYCSLNCYRAPNHQECSEVFYRDCVTEELAARSSGKDDLESIREAKRMYETLKKINEATSDSKYDSHEQICTQELEEEDADSDDEVNDDEGADLATRLDGINLDDADAIWNRLTAAEKQEFETLLKTGDIQNVIPAFKPWWEMQIAKQLIQEMDSESIEKSQIDYPQLIENIPPFELIMKKSPSPCLPNNLYNVLSSYTCTVRFFNGEHHLTAAEAVWYLVQHSATLKSNANFDDTEQAVKSVIAECESGDGMPGWKDIARDVEKIMAGPFEGKRDSVYVKAALSDIHRLLEGARHNLKGNTRPDMDGRLNRKMLLSLTKKIEFFLSFVNKSSNH